MSDNNFKNKLEGADLKAKVVEPLATRSAMEKERQKNWLQPKNPFREREQFLASFGTKSEERHIVDQPPRVQTSELSSMVAHPQHFDTLNQAWELRQYLQIIWKWKWLIIASTLVAATASFVVSSFILPPVYRTSTRLLVEASNEYSFSETIENLTITYQELLDRRPVIEAVAQALDLDPNETAEKIQIQVLPQTPLIELTVEDSDPRLAMEIANQIAVDFGQIARNSRWVQGSKLVVVEQATQPRAPVAPRILFNTLVAALVGCVLATGAAFLIEYLRAP